MKILITTDWYAPAVNGVVTSVKNLAKGLKDRGHEVRILTLSEDHYCHADRSAGIYYIGSVSMAKIYPGARMRIISSRWICDELVAWHPDIIHSQCEFSTFGIATRIARVCGCPIVHTWHTVYEDFTHYFSPSRKAGRLAAAKIAGLVLPRVQGVIAPSEKIRRMLEMYPVRRRPNIYVVPTGLDFSKLKSSVGTECITELRSGLGFSPEDVILLSLGRAAREKNIDELLLYLSASADPHLKLLIAGDGPYRRNLQNMADRLGLGTRVVFAGMVDPTKVSWYYRIADVFVCASRSETQGITYMEAMACGCAMLCRQDPCLEGVITDGGNGFIYRDEREFSEKLRILAESPILRCQMGECAAQSVRLRYSVENFALSVENVYRKTIKASEGVGSGLREEVSYDCLSGSEKGNACRYGGEHGYQRSTVPVGMACRDLPLTGAAAAIH